MFILIAFFFFYIILNCKKINVTLTKQNSNQDQNKMKQDKKKQKKKETRQNQINAKRALKSATRDTLSVFSIMYLATISSKETHSNTECLFNKFILLTFTTVMI